VKFPYTKNYKTEDMFLLKRKYFKLFTVFAALFLTTPVWAEGPPAANPLNNSLAVLLISVMVILLIAIGILASILIGAADITVLKRKKEKAKQSIVQQAAAVFIGFMLLSTAVIAQDKTAANAVETVTTIGGLSSSSFYVMVSIIFLELLVILVLLVNIRLLLSSQKKALVTVEATEAVAVAKQRMNWWSWFNKLRPIEQEADLDLGHDYDGIRELDNRLPPWWLYGFYATIIIAAIYLWRYHISHTAPLSKEEYEIAVQKGEQQKNEYLKLKGEAIDENSIAMLGAADIAEGKNLFTNPAKCAMCHGADASGFVNGSPGVGPNLTDDYWIHGGDIKSVFKTIKYGIDGKGMPEWKSSLTPKQIAQLASFVKSLRGSNPAKAKAPDGQLYRDDVSEQKPTADSIAAKKDNKVAVN
jgi:cytochrome c oxidase cbb3-type subunit 3